MYREQALDNFYMTKEAVSGLLTAGIGGLAGGAGRQAGKEIARDKYKNLTAEDLDRISEESQGAGRGALRGFGYAVGGGALGMMAGKTLPALHLGALAAGTYGGLSSRKKAKKEYLRRAEAMSNRKLLARMRRDQYNK